MDSNLLERILKTDARVIAFGAIAFLALLGPVIIEICISFPDAFKDLTISKLILLALGATLPIAVINVFLCLQATLNDKPMQIQEGTPDINTTAGFFLTAFILYIDVGLQFFVNYSFRTFVIVGLLLEVAIIIWSIPQIFHFDKKINKK